MLLLGPAAKKEKQRPQRRFSVQEASPTRGGLTLTSNRHRFALIHTIRTNNDEHNQVHRCGFWKPSPLTTSSGPASDLGVQGTPLSVGFFAGKCYLWPILGWRPTRAAARQKNWRIFPQVLIDPRRRRRPNLRLSRYTQENAPTFLSEYDAQSDHSPMESYEAIPLLL